MSTRNPTAATMAAAAMAAREALAAGLLSPTRVLDTIEQRSAKGLTWLRLVTPVSLDATKAWRRLLRRLDELGFAARIEIVMPAPGEDEEMKRSELVIGWGPAVAVGMQKPAALLSQDRSPDE